MQPFTISPDTSIAQIAAAVRDGRYTPRPTPCAKPATYTDAERAAWIEDMQSTHRPNAKAAMGGTLELSA